MIMKAIEHYEAALKEAFPRGASGDVFHHWNEARKALEQPEPEPVECMCGICKLGKREPLTMIEMVDAAMVATRNICPPITRSQCETIIRAAAYGIKGDA